MAMLTKASKLASHLSRCSNRSIIDKTGSSNVIIASFRAHLSTSRDGNRSFRGERGGRRDDDEVEFLQSLDFGDGGKGEGSNREDWNQPRSSSARGPNRQWRGDRSGGSNREYGAPPFESFNGQLRRETRSRGAVDADDFFPDSGKGSQFQRGDRHTKDRIRDFDEPDKEEFQSPVEKEGFQSPGEKSSPHVERERGGQNWRAKALGGTGETLFEKLRVGDKNPEPQQSPGEPQTPTVTDETGRTEAESSPPPPQEAEEIFRKMKETGLIPNAVAMLDGLCKDGLVKEAMKLFGLMREKGTIPEVVIYTAVVEAFCKVSRFDDAIRVFRKMQKNGIVPNAFSYGVIVNGLCRGGRLVECEEFCVEMFEAGHSPNPATFVGLVDAFCKAKGVEEGKRIVKRFQDRNFAIDEKSIREHLDKKGPFEGPVWEAIFGRKTGRRHF